MPRYWVPLFFPLLMIICAGCSHGSNGSACLLEGPSMMDEDSTASFMVSVVGEEPVSYDWMIQPPTAGNYDNPHKREVTFHAKPLISESDLEATIGVAVTFPGGVAFKSKKIAIEHVPEDHAFHPHNNQPPTAAAHSDFATVEPGGAVRFFDDSTDPDGKADIVKREWDFSYSPSEGFIAESEDENPVHVFDDEGAYLVQLRVTDSVGFSNMLDEPIEIQVEMGNVTPIAQAHAQSTVVDEGTSIQFSDDSIDANGQSDIVKWEWDFSYTPSEGFNTESLEQNPLTQFPAAGTFDVQLRVTDAGGLSDMLDDPIPISVYRPGWVVSWGGEYASTEVKAVAVDKNGNIYVAGHILSGTVDFDPGPGVANSDGTWTDYISKFDPDGNFVWAVQLRPSIVALYAGDFDGVYFCGYSGSYPDQDACIGLIPSSGDTTGYQIIGHGSSYDGYWTYCYDHYSVKDIVVDSSSNVYCIVYHSVENGHYWFWNDWMLIGDQVMDDYWDEFSLLKLDATGDQIWQRPYATVQLLSIADAHNGDIILAQPYALSRIDNAGNTTWDATVPSDTTIDGVATDSAGNTYYTGQSRPWRDLDPGPGIYYVSTADAMFLCKLDSNMEFVWGRDWTANMAGELGVGDYVSPHIAVNEHGGVAVAGLFSGGADFDPGPGELWHTTYLSGSRDAYVIWLDAAGDYGWSAIFSACLNTYYLTDYLAPPVAADSEGNAIVAGDYLRCMDFDPGPGVDIRPSHNPDLSYYPDGFLAKVSPGDV